MRAIANILFLALATMTMRASAGTLLLAIMVIEYLIF
jgi:hypothetical protein